MLHYKPTNTTSNENILGYFYRGGPQRPGFCIGGDLKVPASKGYGHSFLQDTSRCMEAQLSQPYMVL